MDCHALRCKARNDRKWALLLESWLFSKMDSRKSCSRLDFRAKNGASQGDSRDLP